jgi:hypothetical protein
MGQSAPCGAVLDSEQTQGQRQRLRPPQYTLRFNPIEEFFAELKAFIKKQWHEYEDKPHQDFICSLNGVSVWWEVESRAQEVISGILGGASTRWTWLEVFN